MRRLFLTTIMIIGISGMLLLGGCGQKVDATFEDLAASDGELVTTIQEKITTPEGTKSEVVFSGDSFDITYTYKDQIDEDSVKALKSAFDKNAESLGKNGNKAIEDMGNQTGISGITGSIIILNADGSEIWTLTLPVENEDDKE